MLKPAARRAKATAETFWALRDVSFEVQRGDRVGIVGRNGAGKSTLLKIISRITRPTTGRIDIIGRVSSLLEVGTGFHPELTGRENIYLNGAVLGMNRNEISARFDEIVEFSEVERFLDTPVKRYSSGMYMRLAFAVAAHLEPDILIVDEVLAVGDAAFQKKCLGKMREVGETGRTVLFVSHNMGAVAEFCNRAIMLDHGKVVYDGATQEVLQKYRGEAPDDSSGVFEVTSHKGDMPGRILSITLEKRGAGSSVFDIDDPIDIGIDFETKDWYADVQCALTVSRDAVDLFHAFDNDDLPEVAPTPAGRHRLIYRIPPRTLKEGRHNLSVTLGLPSRLFHQVDTGISFEVVASENLFWKSFRSDRAGNMISPGTWTRP